METPEKQTERLKKKLTRTTKMAAWCNILLSLLFIFLLYLILEGKKADIIKVEKEDLEYVKYFLSFASLFFLLFAIYLFISLKRDPA